MKKWFLFLLLFLISCQEKVSSNPHIALVVPLSGPLSKWGNACQKAVHLALEYSKIKLAIFDNEGNLDKTKKIFLSLAKNKDIIAVIGPLRCDCLEEVLPVIKKVNLPVLSPGCFEDFSLVTDGWAIPILSIEEEIKIIADYINKKNLSWGIFLENNSWAKSISDCLIEAIKIPPVFKKKISPLNMLDFKKLSQIIVIITDPETAGLIVFQIRNPDITFLGFHYLLDPIFLSTAGTTKNILITIPTLSKKIQKKFEKAFLSRYYNLPHWVASCAYVAADGILRSKKLTRKGIKKCLKNYKFPIKFLLKEIKSVGEEGRILF